MRNLQCRIRIEDGICDVGFVKSEICPAYLLLDSLSEGIVAAIFLHDALSAKRLPVQNTTGDKNLLENDRMSLTDNSITCIKRLISQCYLNPYDAQWLHYDTEIHSPQGEEMALIIHILTEM